MRNPTALALSIALVIAGGSVADAQWLRTQPRSVQRIATPTPVVTAPTLRLFASTPSTPRVAPAPQPGALSCRVDENGAPARASVHLVDLRGQVAATGACDQPLRVAAGTYDAVLTLETALDRPTRTVRVTVPSGGVASAHASFATSILEVRFTDGGAPVHGIAYIRRDGRVVGTLGSGVAGRLSAGRYEIVARFRTEDRVYTVDLAPGQRRAVIARF